ncbi:MAG: hypothetical protein K9J16_13105, partial [Melioribacteraceae bacterium]|nr:hypothetical protein [Melioribacteraceae bacterium]
MKSKIILFLSIVSLVSINLFAQDLEPTDEAINEFLSNPAENAIFEIPVLMISYYPTLDGVNLDKEISGSSLTIDEMKMKVDSMSTRAKFMLEEGSKFRGYKNPDAIPSVGYKVIKNIAVYEKMPRGYEVPWNDGWYRPDYNQILERFNAKDFVENLGVKEIWIWGYHHGDIEPAESNMSSPITGDISNSERNEDDLPVYTKSYTVYNYNYNRSQAEAVHNHGHQFEAILTHINKEQDDNSKLFWNLFVGKNEADEFTGGRCGWTHMPPNTTKHYDYLNPAWVESDIENWLPDGSGEKKKVSVETWKNLDYNWVYGDMNFKQKTESQFYIYW